MYSFFIVLPFLLNSLFWLFFDESLLAADAMFIVHLFGLIILFLFLFLNLFVIILKDDNNFSLFCCFFRLFISATGLRRQQLNQKLLLLYFWLKPK